MSDYKPEYMARIEKQFFEAIDYLGFNETQFEMSMVKQKKDWGEDSLSTESMREIYLKLIGGGKVTEDEEILKSLFLQLQCLRRHRPQVKEIVREMDDMSFDLLNHDIQDLYGNCPDVEKTREKKQDVSFLLYGAIGAALFFLFIAWAGSKN